MFSFLMLLRKFPSDMTGDRGKSTSIQDKKMKLLNTILPFINFNRYLHIMDIEWQVFIIKYKREYSIFKKTEYFHNSEIKVDLWWQLKILVYLLIYKIFIHKIHKTQCSFEGIQNTFQKPGNEIDLYIMANKIKL